MSFPVPPSSGENAILAGAETGESVERPAKRQRTKTNVTRACGNCRRKRTKCDGLPRCLTCQLHNLDCEYVRDGDGRRPASKQYVQALENRVRQLEQQYEREETGRSGSGPSLLRMGDEGAGAVGHISDAEGDSTAQKGRSPVMSRDSQPDTGRTIGALRISAAGTVTHYGPSSAYMHLPDEPPPSTNADDDEQADSQFHLRLEHIDWSALAWKRHLAPCGAAISGDVHAGLLEIFFRYLNWWCQWCNEAGFLRDLIHACAILSDTSTPAAPARTLHYSPMLHNAVLAVALLNSPESLPAEYGDSKIMAGGFAAHARAMIEEEMLRPMTTTARGVMLLGSFYFHNLHRNLGWCYAGLGARIAQLLGLNTDFQEMVDRRIITTNAKQHRDQTFWTVYIQDSLWSFNVGRTPTFHVEDYNTALPLVQKEDDENPWLPMPRPSDDPSLTVQRPAWRSSCLLWTAKLIVIGNGIHRDLYRVRQPAYGTTTGLIAKRELELETWLVDLIPPLRLEAWQRTVMPPHILNMHAVFNYFRILLHRPACYDFDSVEAEARKISLEACETAARQLVTLFGSCASLRHATTTLPNIVFTAGTTFLLIAARNDLSNADLREALARVDQCIGFLKQMAWPAAAVGTDILQRMKREWVPPGMGGDAAGNGPAGPAEGVGTAIDGNTVEALRDPNSDIAKLLRSMGWQPPATQSVTDQPGHSQPQSLGFMLSGPFAASRTSTPVPVSTAAHTADPTLLGLGDSDASAVRAPYGDLNTSDLGAMMSPSQLPLLDYNLGDMGSLASLFGDTMSHPLWDPLSAWTMPFPDGSGT